MLSGKTFPYYSRWSGCSTFAGLKPKVEQRSRCSSNAGGTLNRLEGSQEPHPGFISKHSEVSSCSGFHALVRLGAGLGEGQSSPCSRSVFLLHSHLLLSALFISASSTRLRPACTRLVCSSTFLGRKQKTVLKTFQSSRRRTGGPVLIRSNNKNHQSRRTLR